ncbi:DUF5677 domain-containing protein [Micromonospora chersina]|uniref:DUF5677 domain-containing protein n=1 Tax=Micromonospora chersina TaxID=47854 RepID=UPI0037179C8B
MAVAGEGRKRQESSVGHSGADSALWTDVSEVLNGERTLWRAAERLVALALPHVEQTCVDLPLTMELNVDVVSRSIVRRAHDSLTAVTVAVNSPARASARVHLRAMAEDLIFVSWLCLLDKTVATEYLKRSARVEALRTVEAQLKFLPLAYHELATPLPELELLDPTDALVQARHELANLCRAQGWGKRGPSVRNMAVAAGLLPEYEFFYFLSSKAVHANLHEIARMVWGNEHTLKISSDPFVGVHADLAVVYGVWLFDKALGALANMFRPIEQLLKKQAYSIWLAMILVGAARNGKLPLLIHPEELGRRL